MSGMNTRFFACASSRSTGSSWLGKIAHGAGVVAVAAILSFASGTSQGEEAAGQAKMSEAELEEKLAAARKRLDAAAREVADLSMSLSGNVMPHMERFAHLGPHKAMLGINLGPRRDSEPAEGVEVVSVSPGGAAEQAGLKAGDVLLEVNGTALKRDADESARRKLLGALRGVKPGDKVAVSYRRDGKVMKADLVTQPFAGHFFPFTRALPLHGKPGSRFAFMRADGVFGSAELVALTPKLGQYFGAQTGLLVVRAPDDSRLKLEDGDVIVDIDGRTPSSPSHALRILSSYQAGEKLTLNVLRARKRMSFDITIPEHPWEKRIEGAHAVGEDMLMYTPVEATRALPPPSPPPPVPGDISVATPLPDDPV